ncbi:uncharacterized protein [Dysidea avara]|uniref:uncharacterized protein n=1 Tax=Dysidea avara TaxID=196820 RepID=UPI00331A061A
MTSNTVINITSESVTLEDNIKMGSGDLNNITITGNGATIMCNNSGGVYCESCDNVVIEGITWDRCGDPNGTNIAGVTFNITSNISLLNSTFQHSQIRAVSLLEVHENVSIKRCNFISNVMPQPVAKDFGGLFLGSLRLDTFNNLHLIIVNCNFINNGYTGSANNLDYPTAGGLVMDITTVVKYTIAIVDTAFIDNNVAAFITSGTSGSISLLQVNVHNNSIGVFPFGGGITFSNYEPSTNTNFSIGSSVFSGNVGSSLWFNMNGNVTRVVIYNTKFTDNGLADTWRGNMATIGFISQLNTAPKHIMLYDVLISNNVIAAESVDHKTGAISLVTIGGDVKMEMNKVILSSNQYLGHDGGAVFIQSRDNYHKKQFFLQITSCKFIDNASPGHGSALYINSNLFNSNITIADTIFDHNFGVGSTVYITSTGSSAAEIQLSNSNFTNNIGSSLYIPFCHLTLLNKVIFKNNKADNGAVVYLHQGSTIHIDGTHAANILFLNNTSTQYGGAIYVDLLCNTEVYTFTFTRSPTVLFSNNSAGIAGNSIYFNVPKSCAINTDVNNYTSIMFVPCSFSYFQPANGEVTHIPCDYDYTLLNGTGPPIVTSPHEVRLYFPNNDGVNISSNSDHNIYYIKNNILGHEVVFKGAVFDYFGKPVEPIQISVECIDCFSIHLVDDSHLLVDNTTQLSVSFMGHKIDGNGINMTLSLRSVFYSLLEMSTRHRVGVKLIVELLPCSHHPGNMYNEENGMCVCYHRNLVFCYDTYNEIRRGYWFGSVGGTPTTSLCPNHYCNFVDRKETRQGYFELPRTINGQCDDHRSGTACGECGPGHTLAYDSTDCISVDHCSTGMTVLVVVLTCLYWIVLVVGVFSLMYFNFQISSGYVYGIIYYYSMVGILLDNNPYISDGAFQFVSILSSFAQLSPQFLGQLCFVKGLSGIDQLFIHYSHAVAVSILTLVIVLAARCSIRVTVYISRCIIHVICLLLLLSYTSLTSTSLQLLQPLKFTDINRMFTYASPNIEYFYGRHAIYGIVAVICELVVGIGLPLLLLLEPLLSRKINFIKIKPLLDQFQGCYKDKYRWFAAYYLICRQVIMLIVFVGNSNYYSMLYYLQTACMFIAMIHIWIQPYQDESLNALDGLSLLIMVLIVNVNIFSFLQNSATEISLVLVILPLFLFCITKIRKIIWSFIKKERLCEYGQMENPDERLHLIGQNAILYAYDRVDDHN